MPFFATGGGGGPWSTPYQPGIIDRVAQIADTLGGIVNLGMGLVNRYKQQKQQSALQPIKVARELYPDQPVPIDQAAGKRLESAFPGLKLPRTTTESNAMTMGGIWQGMAQSGTPKDAAGRMLTSPQDPKQILREQIQAKALASMPEEGEYLPLPGARPKTLEEAVVRSLKPGEDPRAIYQTIKGKQNRLYRGPNNALYNIAGQQVVTGEEPTTTFLGPQGPYTVKGKNVKADPYALAATKEGYVRGRPTTIIDDETQLPTGTVTGKVHFQKGKKSGEVQMLTETQATDMAKAGKTVPKGTKIIKDTEYNAARNEAVKRATTDLTTMGNSQAQEEQINKLTKQILQERAKGKSARSGSGTGTIPQTRPAPGGNATYTGRQDSKGYPIYKLPNGKEQAWAGE